MDKWMTFVWSNILDCLLEGRMNREEMVVDAGVDVDVFV